VPNKEQLYYGEITDMNSLRPIAIVLIVLGVIAFAYGFIRYRTPERVIDAGPVHITAEKTHTINLPPALGAAALAGGLVLLIVSAKKA
jgi:uncharacterized membrane protein YidH (DUF202 family)